MLNIGEFARTTGLTVKALRHYDEKDLLTPAQTDPDTGYRRYDIAQIRPAATLGVLRTMGLSITQAKRALDAADDRDALLEEHRRAVLAERERQDLLWVEGRAVLAGYATPTALQERRASSLPWAGITSPLPSEESEDGDRDVADEVVDRLLDQLLSALAAREAEVTGPCWLAFRCAPGSTQPELVLAVGLAQPLSGTAPAGSVPGIEVTGILPERTERFVRVDPASAMSPELSAPHPGMVALIAAAGVDGIDHLRQSFSTGEDGGCLELIVDVL